MLQSDFSEYILIFSHYQTYDVMKEFETYLYLYLCV